MSEIIFDAAPFLAPPGSLAEGQILVRLPAEASALLPSRGMSMMVGTFNDEPIVLPVEPDGEGSHWFAVSQPLLDKAHCSLGQKAKLVIEPTKTWPEPTLPDDLIAVLDGDAKAEVIWKTLTPAARWDWVRWMSAPKLPETRKRRVDSIPSRLRSGKRRPCCFDRSQCTLTVA